MPKVIFEEDDIKALLEALVEGERIKPFQAAKRSVFEKYGLLGTRKDRIFTAIIYKMYRKLGVVDKAIEHGLGISKEELESMDPMLRQGLRLAAYLAQFDEVGDLELVRAYKRYGLRLIASKVGWREARKVAKLMDRLRRDPWRPVTPDEMLESEYMVPPMIFDRLVRLLGRDEAMKALEHLNRDPTLGLRVNTLKASVDEVLEEVKRLGLEAWRSERVEEHIRYRGPFVKGLRKLVARGLVIPQDESSALAAKLLEPRPGELIVDLCAAPGGKTTHIAQLTRLRSKIVAFDVLLDRLQRLRWLAEATGTIDSIAIIKADAKNAPKIVGVNVADRALLDPPCTTTGALSKNPDARWRITESKVAELSSLQRELLEAGVKTLKPGGRLLYTVCSILPEEGEEVIKWALENLPVRLVPLRGPYEESKILPGTMRAWPHKHDTTGFFYALLEKTKPWP